MRFFEIFHSRSRVMPSIGPRETWPEEWTNISSKKYPALKEVQLRVSSTLGGLAKALKERCSSRVFSGNPISSNQLSQILSSALGDHTRNESPDEPSFRRAYPSAGSRYPLEAYVLIITVEGISPGLYHYDPEKNSLSLLNEVLSLASELATITGYPWVNQASAVIFITAMFGRTIQKYGERGYRLTLLEAGHAGQCVYLAAGEAGVKCCALALANEIPVNTGLNIDGVTEGVIHTIALGV